MNFLFKKTKTTRFLFFLIADIILIFLAIIIAFLLRFEGIIPEEYFIKGTLNAYVGLAIFFCVMFFYVFGLYSFSWSYVSTQELVSLLKAQTLAFTGLGTAIFLLRGFPFFDSFPRSVFFISYFIVFIFCGGSRFSKRIYLNFIGIRQRIESENTLIVGAGDTAEQIIRSILSSKNTFYNPVAIVDDNNIKQGISIHGVKVLGKIADIPDIINKKEIKQVIVTLPSTESKLIREVVEIVREQGIRKIKIIPHLSEIIAGSTSFRNLKDVEVDDLLGRDQVILDTKQIEKFIKDKTVLITGAAGSIGSELAMQVAELNPLKLLLLDQDETGIFNISNNISEKKQFLKIVSLVADITDKDKIENIFKTYSPKIVFHAAAYKHVPLMEDSPDEAVKNNIFGTKIVAEASIKYGVEKFVMISTDKAVNPVSVMGLTKRIAEMICQALNNKNLTKFISVRFGNVLDSRGSVIPIFREQIKKGGPVTVTHPEMKRYFMLIPEACLLVLQAGAMGNGGEVFVLDMGKPIKIIDLAKEMIRLSGYEPDKDIAITYIGSRPGEKMFEEILSAEEGVIATQNKKIFEAKLSDIPESFLNQIEKLDLIIKKGSIEEIKKELKLLTSQKF